MWRLADAISSYVTSHMTLLYDVDNVSATTSNNIDVPWQTVSSHFDSSLPIGIFLLLTYFKQLEAEWMMLLLFLVFVLFESFDLLWEIISNSDTNAALCLCDVAVRYLSVGKGIDADSALWA